MTWFSIQDDTVTLRILVKPYAKRSEIVGLDENQLSIAIHALPQSGAANQALVNYLSQLLEVPKTKIILKNGQQSRYKRVVLPLTAKIQFFLDHPRHFLNMLVAK